jgi:transmembrane sensor
MAMDARLLDEAADWLMRLHGGGLSAVERADFERWRQAGPEHAHAWERAERLMGKLGSLPAALAMPTLDRPVRRNRRAAAARLAALLAVAPAGWLGWRLAQEHGWTADLRTATGEQRTMTLADGSRLLLDTGTAVDIKFDSAQRLLYLRQGAILLETAADSSGAHRPLLVDTALGRLRALGTRFTVRLGGVGADASVLLAVTEGAVEVTPRGAARPALVVPAGRQTVLTGQGASPPQPVAPQAQAWVHGMLMADAMPLAEVCAQLARYRPGILHCAPEVEQLKVSGAYPLADTDRALAMLADTYAVRVGSRWQGYWVTVTGR